VLHNARVLGLDLAEVEEVVLSHFHDDHTSGLTTLRRELRKKNKRALSVANVGGFSWLRRGRGEPYFYSTRTSPAAPGLAASLAATSVRARARALSRPRTRAEIDGART
jgi:7,8-dihydropterin-6-yl-methyl-4-(beta-D-ribofuranosyl)aminobenzene 5'-phosphate synthase